MWGEGWWGGGIGKWRVEGVEGGVSGRIKEWMGGEWRGGEVEEWSSGGMEVVGWLSEGTECDSKEMNWNHV